MTMPTATKPKSQKRQVHLKTLGLYPSDLEDAETIRAHYQYDSFAQAVRRAIRDAAKKVKEGQAAA